MLNLQGWRGQRSASRLFQEGLEVFLKVSEKAGESSSYAKITCWRWV